MLYPFIFIVLDFFQNLLCFEFFYDTLIHFVVVQCLFCGVSRAFHLCYFDSSLIFSFSVQVSLSSSSVGIAREKCICNLVCFSLDFGRF